jgi:putative nucleotidyltransferase with HDIG domain
MRVILTAFLAAVIAGGASVLALSIVTILNAPFDFYIVVLAVATVASGRLAVKVPGHPATVSVSEVFVFASALLFSPAVATLIVTLDGIWASMRQKDRRLYRTLFNVAEPALSTWLATSAFYSVARSGLFLSTNSTLTLVIAALCMAGVFFIFNSGLTSVAIALESKTSALAIWRSHSWYLAINYYAAASLATVMVGPDRTLNFAVVGLVLPLLMLSYIAYREAAKRLDAAHHHVQQVEHLYHATVEMLAIAVDAKDQVTHAHVRRVQRHALTVAKAIGVTDALDLKAIEAGALLHDIGKLAVPDHVLNKPTVLSRSEYEAMKTHVIMGARILTAVDFPYPIVPIVRHHHEQWNGRGYPDGLAGTEIPVGARILAVVDCFDALTSDRPYRPRLSDDAAAEVLKERRGVFYDPAIVDAFLALRPTLRSEDAMVDEDTDLRGAVVRRLVHSTARHNGNAGDHSTYQESDLLVTRRIKSVIEERISQITSGEACLFVLDASSSGALRVAYATPRLGHAMSPLEIPLGSGVSGWVAAHRTTITSADPALDLGKVAAALRLRACTSTPVFAGGELFGVLTMYDSKSQRVPEAVSSAVGVLGQEIGLMIARAESDERERTLVVARGLSASAVS